MDLNNLFLESIQTTITNHFFLFALFALSILLPVFGIAYFIFKGVSKKI